MEAISINILNRIKMFVKVNNLTSKQACTVQKEGKQEHCQSIETGSNKESDLVVFQRKAYMGHFMAGPIALFHPELFK